MATPTLQPVMNTRQAAPIRFLGLPTLLRATGASTRGAFGLIEQWKMPPGFASPYHVHRREDEAFYILEGEIAFVCGGQWITAGPGSYVFGPRNIPHGFRVEGTANARLLLLCAPAGFEQFVLDLSEPEPASGASPTPPDMAKLAATAANYGIEILGPLPERTAPAAGAAETDAARIEALRQTHIAALNSGNAAAWAGLFAADAVQMPPNAPANAGRENISAWAGTFLRAFNVKFSLSVADLHVAGDHAFETGAYRIALTPRGGPVIEDVGKYITVYQRSASGGWEIARDIWNSDRPLPGN